MSILKKGLRGEPVRRLQEALGVDADGIFGKGTEAALRNYQEANGLDVDGVAGPDTFALMGLHELVLLKKGTKGDQVRLLQEALGVDADGIFGGGTETAVREFQEANGLDVDGMAGPATLALIDSFTDITDESVGAAMLPDDYEDPDLSAYASQQAEDVVDSSEPEPTAEEVLAEAAKVGQDPILASLPEGGVWGSIKGA